MRVGLAYDLKQSVTLKNSAPEDALEEYDSPNTIEYIRKAIESAGHSTVKLGGGSEFLRNILGEKVDIVFNISEGRGTHRSREAQVPSVLEMMDIPYTGSDPLCLAVALDKPLTKKLAAMDGVITPKWVTISNQPELERVDWHNFPYPAIAKPAFEGSSIGVHATSLVESPQEAIDSIGKMLSDYQQPIMVEQFIDGDEITVGLVGNTPAKVIGMMRILPRQKTEKFVYSVEVKRDWKNLVDYETPVKMEKSILTVIEKMSLKTFQLLGCRDFARIDFRVSKDGIPYMLEINPLPGLGDYSDFVIMAQKMGWTHASLIVAVFNAALERCKLCPSA